MKLTLRALWLVTLLVGAAACLPLATPLPPIASSTPLPTAAPTPTTIWFPPTPTATIYPTPTGVVTPTVDVSPKYGPVIYQEDFSDPGAWNLGRTSAGVSALGQNELTIAISQPQGYLYSVDAEHILSDFYLEINASPSICRGEDQYGLLLKFTSELNYYRFALTCDGRTRLDRIYQGDASSPQPPIYSGAVPLGAPSISRLGVHAMGKEMRFYVNGLYQFTIRDATLPKGIIGVFARAAGEDVMTVIFSDLIVYQAAP